MTRHMVSMFVMIEAMSTQVSGPTGTMVVVRHNVLGDYYGLITVLTVLTAIVFVAILVTMGFPRLVKD